MQLVESGSPLRSGSSSAGPMVRHSAADMSDGPEDHLPRLIDAIGEQDFELRLQQFLWDLCGADHFGVFRVGDSVVGLVAADPTTLGRQRLAVYKEREMWRLDPLLRQAMRARHDSPFYRVQVYADCDMDPLARKILYHTIRDRYFVFGGRAGSRYALTVLRSSDIAIEPSFGITKLNKSAHLLLSVLAKHYDRQRELPSMRVALSSTAEIEQQILLLSAMPRREAAVCARLLYGMMIPGIALDLEITEESVKTYRKRIYHRLSIGSARELLVWYMGLLASPSPEPAIETNSVLTLQDKSRSSQVGMHLPA